MINSPLNRMNTKPNFAANAAELRRLADARLRGRTKPQRSAVGERKSAVDTQRLPHELQVHQVELEMQNAELQEARNRMEILLDKYTDLYDFAPVGYFSLDERGLILEVNLMGATMLGVERSRLINRRLEPFVIPTSRLAFRDFLAHVFAASETQVCESTLLKADGTAFWADFHATTAVSLSGPRKWCRVAASDITALKRAEEAQRRTEALAIVNRQLNQEIIRRQAMEEALRSSEQHQSQLLEQSRHMQEELRHLSHQIIQAQEEERKRISRELHDEITQTLVGINVHLATLAAKARVNPQGLKQMIVRTQRLVEQSVHTVHQFARELRPTALDDLGLIVTLHALLKDYTKRTGLHVHFTACTAGRIKQLDATTRTVFYRVAQEALTNVAQHAHASQVKVSIRKLPDAVCMEITDNGVAFEVDQVLHARRNQRLGLIGMRERVEMVGGKLSIESVPGQGTAIRAQIPFGSRSAKGKALVKPSNTTI